ncbi:alpha/beta fold hydrolase [Flavobacteriaceae bacterium]|nr:alpha/beta fold hydrolase [Flavobacteriaceae bacterium]
MLEYRIRKAENNLAQSPVMFLIHGYGSNSEDLFSFASYLPKSHTIIALQAPILLAHGSYAWYQLYPKEDGSLEAKLNEAQNALDLIIKNIELLVNKYNLNSLDLSVLGFSQGAMICWALAYSKPKKVRRIIALSGLIHESIDTSKSPEFVAYAAHGINDIVISLEMARKSVLPLSKKHKEIEYYEFNDGHTVSNENFSKMLAWLEKTNL